MQKIIVAVFVSAVELAQFFMMGTFLIVTFFIDADAYFLAVPRNCFIITFSTTTRLILFSC
jgi:hypothetical protein